MPRTATVIKFRRQRGEPEQIYELDDPQKVRELVVSELDRIWNTPRIHEIAIDMGVRRQSLYSLVTGRSFLPRTANMFKLFKALGFTVTAMRM